MRLFALCGMIILSMGLFEASAFLKEDSPNFWQVLNGGDDLRKPQLFSEVIDNVREEHIHNWWEESLNDDEFLATAQEAGVTAIAYGYEKVPGDGIERIAIRYLDIRNTEYDTPELSKNWKSIQFIYNDRESSIVAINKGNGLVTTFDSTKAERTETILVNLLAYDKSRYH